MLVNSHVIDAFVIKQIDGLLIFSKVFDNRFQKAFRTFRFSEVPYLLQRFRREVNLFSNKSACSICRGLINHYP